MKRTLTLRRLQLLDQLKLTMLLMLAFGLLLAVFIGLALFIGANSSVTIESKTTWISGGLQILSSFFSIWSIIVFFTDGMTDFDSALRFGINRKHYVISNCFIYAAMTVVGSFLSFVSDKQQLPSWELFLSEFWGSFAGCFVIAIVGFAVYKWGWKIFLGLLALSTLSSIVLGIVGIVLQDKLPRVFDLLLQSPAIVYNSARAVALLAIISLYYWIVTRIEVK
ncbi:hypothetical protein MKL29_07625 [Streptococcus suis]|nr:hypothetical protein [Streptococcus suis]